MKDLGQVIARHREGFGDVIDTRRLVTPELREMKHGAQGVLGCL
jgi:hypothetical protein